MAEHGSKSSGRRRTPVACNRCRRRKIKCSGDTHDGRACTNCRSSREPDCLFLRVKATVVETLPQYSHFHGTVLNPNGPLSAGALHQGNYESHQIPRSTPITPSSTPATSSSYAMLQPSFDSGSGNGQSLIQRSPYNPAYPLASYEDDNSYHPQHPQSHTITTNVDIADGAIFGASAGGKSWYDSYPMKALHGAFSENDANNGLASSGYPFLFQHSQMTPVQTENVPAFSVTSSLSTGLTSSDRTLPNPLGYRNSTYLPEHVANSSVGPSSMLSYRPWESDKPVLNEIIIPRSGSSVTSSSRSSETSRPSPTSPSDVEFGYIPVSADLSPLVHSPSIGSTSDAMRFSDRYATIHEPRRTKGPDIYTSELYGYTTKRSSARGYTSSAHEYERNTVEYDSIPINRADLMPRLAPLSPRHNAQGI